MKKAIINGKVILDKGIEEVTIIYDKNIQAIGKDLDVSDCEVIDVKGAYVAPGFLDIHIHGSLGADVMDGKETSLEVISNAVLNNGVTRFLATTMTMSKEDIKKSFETVKDYMGNESGGKILGIHVEGPFINKSFKGAQAEKYIIAPEMSLVEDHLDIIKLMTVAPEVEGTLDFIEKAKKVSDVRFSVGHSAASYEEAIKGYENGVDSTTHMFNAMTGLHHRNPGIVGAVFKNKPYFEVIADKIHVHPALFDIIGDAVGKDKMILVTDAMCACQMTPGHYELGGQKVVVDETSARLENGVLAGSILRMNEAIRNVYKNTNYQLHEVVKMASKTPAKMLGLEGIGLIEEGYVADFSIFNDNIDIEMTIVDGLVKLRRG
ncbi:N-acetylglucosamine-6-phosphate deacetylase [Acidaminobacter sp. JC074]|uniref:N-acetylglucosamine-6-phosphate deacetylase n=1 Tax=Acidaminobacter sp. JC074 TaxID=2530199 RepID=UPI001F0F081D|nr:N-acetylglucosamine-6-phosphate deacetylase [Acidaminobacter sp. JC074]MCH4890772.1 N-acetylglucosamine-6-phosphate deacetylase [Acidaminobacter sp. JC074]